MARNVRERMVTGALELLARKGLQATSFAEVTQATSTPRGSIYHHFPGGKQEMVREALDMNCVHFRGYMEGLTHDSPAAFIGAACAWWRAYVDNHDFKAGCAVTAVTVAAENVAQLDQSAAVFADYVAVITEGLMGSGANDATDARSLAYLVISALEGVTILTRAARDFTAFDAITECLVAQAGQLATD